MDEDTVTVSARPLRELLEALVGPGHFVREMQVTFGLPEELTKRKNPLAQLIEEFNEQIDK